MKVWNCHVAQNMNKKKFGQTEGFAGNSKTTYEVCDSKSEISARMYCFEGTPLHYIASRRGALNGWIMIGFCQEMACLAVYNGF